jgi:hypothetical protein
LAAVLLAGGGLAQPRNDEASKPGTGEQERPRMREQMDDVYRNRAERGDRPERPPRMSPEQRERLRRDIEDANKDLKRRKSE